MMLIDCPWCGPRNETEYGYGGEAHVAYPADPSALNDNEWAKFLFYRKNPKGLFAERWVHAAGCRRWFNAVRDTVTYEFKATYKPGETQPIKTTNAPPTNASAPGGTK
ncbi:sarcosine oxidase subunit delta [Arthrobacter sp. MYb227]|uniref:sarcosine oxidase subunit delta n=1 Tax=Arthrobacter sp. MYb227 TaxID=1848601 RepID=UPI000CFD74BB|nr:sarcosine oxidase subunit delta [Arthrobacter sp. MYb227]PQZ88186.1 sarcosine oxidase subunit delta [Arthrobacter sp. MYb227]